MIERIESLAFGTDFSESFEGSQFKVHLTSGDIVVVRVGNFLYRVHHRGQSSNQGRKPGMKTRKARTKKMLVEKRKSIAAKASKTAAKARARRAKKSAAKAPRAKKKDFES